MEKDNDKAGLKEVIAIVRWSFSLARKYEPRLLVENILYNVLLAIFTYLQLASFSKIVDEVIVIQQNGAGIISKALIVQTFFLTGSFIVPSILKSLKSKNDGAFRPKMMTHLQVEHIEHFSKLDIGTIESPQFQQKLAFANEWGLGSILNTLFNSIDVIRNAVSVLTAAVILFLINPVLVLLAVIGSIPTYFTEEKYGRMLFRASKQQTDDTRIINDRQSFFFNANKLLEVSIFNIAHIFKLQLVDLRTTWIRTFISITNKKAIATFVTDLMGIVGLFAAIAIIVYGGIQGTVAIGSLVLAFTAYRNFGSNTTLFFHSVTKVQEQVRYAVRWHEIYEIQPTIFSKENAVKPVWETPPVIEFKDVEFTYPDTEKIVLQKVNLTINSGEKLALVGLNGAGKTTLVKLLARVYDPVKGNILIDGIDLREIDIDWWRANLGILFQNFSNFQMSAREAIAISRPGNTIDEKKVIKAAEQSGAIDFIDGLPNKYDQLLWKGYRDGVELSQGQHQRMAVARIFYRDALISVLDEPTSAIDAVAEEKIFEVLETKMTGKTVVLISHRFSTVKNADKIAVIEHGELKELGSHKELMAKAGRYHELYTMQANRYLESE